MKKSLSIEEFLETRPDITPEMLEEGRLLVEAKIKGYELQQARKACGMTQKEVAAKMGVSQGTASFVASFGTTAGMQGCAGVFPALLIVFVCHLGNIPLDVTMIIMSIIVITIGSLGIAGIPGTATMAASVALSGTGLASFFPLISPILAIDPLIDMGRTLLNVAGSMVNAIVVDKSMGTFDEAKFNDMKAGAAEGEADEV